VIYAPASLVVVPVHPVALEPSPVFRCCATASTRCSAATPPRPLSLLASPACARRVDAFSALNRGLELEIEFAGEVTTPRRRSPPVAAVGLRSPPSRRSRAFCAVGSRSSVSDVSTAPQTAAIVWSTRVKPGQTQPARQFYEKPPMFFRNSQIYPSTLKVFLQFSLFSLS
jgi:hypothetical protein